MARRENVPPYVIAHDSVLKNITKSKPLTKEDMLKVDGVGEKNFDRYGVYFLKIIRSTITNEQNGIKNTKSG